MSNVQRFIVRAAAQAQSLPRVLAHFAARDLVPRSVDARVTEDMLTIILIQEAMSDATAALIAANLTASVLVDTVELTSLA